MNEALLQNARRLQQAGQLMDAARLYSDILRANPRNFDALLQLANIHLANKRFGDAEQLYAMAAKVNAEPPELFYNQGYALQSLGRHQEALAAYAHALARKPDYVEARNNRGTVLLGLKRHAEALACFDRVLAQRPDLWIVHNNRGTALLGMMRREEALAAADTVLAQNPHDAQALYNRGAALMMGGRREEALDHFNRALQANPHYADALTYRGIVLAVMSRHEDALADYNRALSIKPGDIEILYNRATSLWVLKAFEEVTLDLERVLTIDPNYKYARGTLVQTRLQCSNWHDVPEHEAKIAADLAAGTLTLNPLANITISDSPTSLLKSAQLWVANECAPQYKPVWTGERYDHDRIRIAYVSGDFRRHAVAQLSVGLFEQHDRSRFETVALSLLPGDGTPIRQRLEKAFDRFIDVHEMSDDDVAGLLREMEIDIAVDLTGFTEHARTPIFARRPAGLQVNFVGFPGTMGAPYIDYIVGDPTIIPEDHRPHFQEKVAYLPHTYLPNDSARIIAEKSFARAEQGLPERGFVFCTFNNLFKIRPEIFEVWMRLLRAVDGSVLWLPELIRSAMHNLRREAEARGVARERICFAPFVPSPEEHLARLKLADLFLDTLPYNAHATTCDALWAGVPVLTRIGNSFAGRVGASVLSAVGLPELITHTAEEYEALALKLARNPAALKTIRDRLARNRLTQPLFDTARFTRNLESAYVTMWEHHQRGEPPESFAVADTSAS
jgi:predicted O-linked N-acetylglucosamine transferase (SPINDLY family)